MLALCGRDHDEQHHYGETLLDEHRDENPLSVLHDVPPLLDHHDDERPQDVKHLMPNEDPSDVPSLLLPSYVKQQPLAFSSPLLLTS